MAEAKKTLRITQTRSAIGRKADMRFVSDNAPKRITVTGSNLEEFLGVRRYLPDEKPATDQVGLVTGLAWTSVGGETLEVEVNVVDGTGKLELTGNLGDVMKESAHAAMVFSFNPPMASTRPRMEISPVMAMSRRTVAPVSAETIAVQTVIPAEGPSLGTAPSGKWTWISLVW